MHSFCSSSVTRSLFRQVALTEETCQSVMIDVKTPG
jgi:hypothetical protein